MERVEPNKGRERKSESRAWRISMTLVESSPKGDRIIAEIPPMEYSAAWIGRVSKRHGTCTHPTDLSCQLLRRAAESLRGRRLLRGSGLEGLAARSSGG